MDAVPSGKAKSLKGVSTDPAHYPEDYSYDPAKHEVHVGDGRFAPVEPDVWEFEVSGLKVVQSVARLPDEEAVRQEIVAPRRHPS